MKNMVQGFFYLCLALIVSTTNAEPYQSLIHHDLDVRIEPGDRQLFVRDTITLAQKISGVTLYLHAGLEPAFSCSEGEVKVLHQGVSNTVEAFTLELPEGASELIVEYKGKIHHSLSSSRAEQARGFQSTAGMIDTQGVFLSAGSYWYPQFADYPLISYTLDVSLPTGWSSISQGERHTLASERQSHKERWQINKPQEEIYLIAAQFEEYSKKISLQTGDVDAHVFLRSEDQSLAEKYLDATKRYLVMYEQLLGPYAYSKFALVENFWETGYGMPSFTLLGSKVIRLPFIINSSYPHEILHNWWGNGVYVDYSTGNWSEGLTAYLADHLIKEQQNQGSNYRQQSLQKYRDYASKHRDFPLKQFRSRHSPATEAVGYGKTMMLFHMLRTKLGDELFIHGLRRFYAEYRFGIAGFDDLQQIFEEVSGQALEQFFSQWVNRTGAPELVVRDYKTTKTDSGYNALFTIEQVQSGPAYALDIPVAFTLAGQAEAELTLVSMTEKQETFSLSMVYEPIRLDVDPQFDVFRKLAKAETPPAFTELLGSDNVLVVLPSRASTRLKKAWQSLAQNISHMGPKNVEIVWDSDLEKLPVDRALVILGWQNQFAAEIQREIEVHPLEFDNGKIHLLANDVNTVDHTFAWITRTENKSTLAIPRAFIATDKPSALAGFGRKFPHYHKYSYLGFSGEEPQNRIKGRWPVSQSPLSIQKDSGSQIGKFPTPSPLTDPVSAFDIDRLSETVRKLSHEDFQGRGLGSDGLEQAAQYIAQVFKTAGLKPGGENDSFYQNFTAIGENGETHTLSNVIGVIPGVHHELGKENLVIGAHYDHLGLGWPDVRGKNKGKIHHGADDNASGVAVLLELARVLADSSPPDRTLIFVAFSAEEAGRLGSKHFVKNTIETPFNISIAMLNLDSVGRLGKQKLMVLGSESASEWPHIFRGIGFVTGIQSTMVNESLDASDQISFHESGIPAVQLFTGAHVDYHRPGDTADKIDSKGMLKITEVSRQVIDYLASRPEPLTHQLNRHDSTRKSTSKKRVVSLGTIPDFTYQGEGYRLEGVLPHSPALDAGLTKMDIITAFDKKKVKNLRDVSAILKALKPGQTVEISFLRNGIKKRTMATLAEK